MRYLAAISFCEEDSAFAETIWSEFCQKRAGSYFYKKSPQFGPLLLGYHQSIYSNAHCRIYLLRRRSFIGKVVSFELLCGRGLKANIVVPIEPNISQEVPNDFLFVNDPSWKWLPHNFTGDAEAVVSFALRRIPA